MKKILNLTIILIGLIVLVSPVATGYALDGTQDPDIPDDWVSIFLPLVTTGTQSYSVSGQVKDAQDLPLSEVTITAGTGATTITDESGYYSLTIPRGAQEIEAAKDGYVFDPATAQVDVNQSVSNLHFTAMQQCTNPIPNSSFEILYFYWNPISGNANGYTPFYTNLQANTGLYSGFTGIPISNPLPPLPDRDSWSRFRTHEITIPAASTSATLTFSFWPQTTETVVPDPLAAQALEVGFDTEAPDAPSFPTDFYYVAVINADNEIVDWVFTNLANDQAWTTYGPIDMLQPHLIGQTFRLEIGTYNNTTGGITMAYVDDIEMDICPSAPPSTGCYNLLLNSTFEADTDWVIKAATQPSAYSTEYWYSGARSMRNGVPAGLPNPFPGQWTTSEFYQPVTIPANAYYAQLNMRLLPRSTQPSLASSPLSVDTTYDSLELTATEAQYGFVMDPTGINDYRMLFKWFPTDSAYWLYRSFDLIDFRGMNISVLFGAANDGYNGDTGLWVDDVYLEICQ